jgi:hypothetical protein
MIAVSGDTTFPSKESFQDASFTPQHSMLQNNVGSALKVMSEKIEKMDSVPDLIKSARSTNKREEREEREIPTLGPLGSK